MNLVRGKKARKINPSAWRGERQLRPVCPSWGSSRSRRARCDGNHGDRLEQKAAMTRLLIRLTHSENIVIRKHTPSRPLRAPDRLHTLHPELCMLGDLWSHTRVEGTCASPSGTAVCSFGFRPVTERYLLGGGGYPAPAPWKRKEEVRNPTP